MQENSQTTQHRPNVKLIFGIIGCTVAIGGLIGLLIYSISHKKNNNTTADSILTYTSNNTSHLVNFNSMNYPYTFFDTSEGDSSIVIDGATIWTSSITSITFGNGYSMYSSFGNGFLSSYISLSSVNFLTSSLNRIDKIDDFFLYGCSSLVSMPDSFTSIGNKIKDIGNNFMVSCSRLSSISIDSLDNISSIGDNFMLGCSNLSRLNIENWNTISSFGNLSSIGKNFLNNCSSLSSVDLSKMNNQHFFENLCSLSNDESNENLNWFEGDNNLKIIYFPNIDTSEAGPWASLPSSSDGTSNRSFRADKIFSSSLNSILSLTLKVYDGIDWDQSWGPMGQWWYTDSWNNVFPSSNVVYIPAKQTTII